MILFPPMSAYLPTMLTLAASGLLVAGQQLHAQTVYSKPAGFVKLGDPTPGEPAVKPDTDVSLAIPLERETVYGGDVASTTTDPEFSITVQDNPNWSLNQWAPSPGTPYVAIITSGSESGLRGLITANTGDTLTLAPATPGDLTQVTSADSVVIRKCWTLKTIFEDADLDNNCQVFLYDPRPGINHSSSRKYFYFESEDKWRSTTFQDADDTVIHPGERFVFRSKTNPVTSLALFGNVRDTRFLADLSKLDPGQIEDIGLAHADPIPVAVGDLGLPEENGDTILVYDNTIAEQNKSSSVKLEFWSLDNEWHNLSNFAVVSETFMLEPGQGFVLRRSASSADEAQWQMEPHAPISEP